MNKEKKLIINDYIKNKKQNLMYSFFSMIIFIVLVLMTKNGAVKTNDKEFEKYENPLFAFCDYHENIMKLSYDKITESQMEPLNNLHFCNKISELKKKGVDLSHIINDTKPKQITLLELALLSGMGISFLLAFLFMIKAYDKDFFYDFNENERFLYNWVLDLKMKGVFKNEEEFDLWINGFSERYSERELFIMKLIFI